MFGFKKAVRSKVNNVIANADLNSLVAMGVLSAISISSQEMRWLTFGLLNLISRYTIGNTNRNFVLNPNADDRDEAFMSGNGMHILKYKGKYFYARVNRSTEQKLITSDININVTIYAFKNDEEALKDMTFEAYGNDVKYPAFQKVRGTDHIVTVGRITPIYGKQPQYLCDGVYDQITKPVERMLGGRQWYEDRILPYKETFLLYGEPRTGKSNVVRHIASKYHLDIVTASPDTVADTFINSGGNKPKILLLEDIDSCEALCHTTVEKNIEKNRKVNKTPEVTNTPAGALEVIGEAIGESTGYLTRGSYSDFINYFDGVMPLDNLIVFMTTNYIEKLKPSVIGEGRINHKINVRLLNQTEILNHLGDSPIYNPIRDIENYEIGMINVAHMAELAKAETEAEVKAIINRNKV